MTSKELAFIPFRERDNHYVPLVVVLTLVLIALLFIFGVAYRPVAVDGDSMLDTLRSGDHLLVTRTYPVPARGDIVSVDVVVDGIPDSIVKRVAALPGDTVQVEGDVVWVNGVPATWPGVVTGSADDFHLGPFEVLPGTVYILGDNRPVSLDSRSIGPIPVAQIRGKAIAIFSPVTRAGHID
ncbi:MAG: signal peptidase I [Coriobacteriia bacterium]|nr:signal peptidase I [Coriobacteriia bacterium]